MSADFTDRTRAISFAMGRSDGVADGAGLAQAGEVVAPTEGAS